MKRIILIISIICILSCNSKNSNSKKQNNGESIENIDFDAKDIVGFFDRSKLNNHPHSLWFDKNYQDYKLDELIIEEIKPLIKDFEITIFMGTWCEESQKDLPGFLKILDMAELDKKKLQLIGMTEEKTTPDNLEKDLDIFNIPTYIFKKNGKEINRIVEFPVETLEKDVLKILSGQEYKNIYADF